MGGNLGTRQSRGFTLVELLVVTSIISIIATIALPFLLSSKISANEKSAIATLRLIGQSQIQFVTSGAADTNNNGAGEYGTLGELSGSIAIRAANGGTNTLAPTLISPSFGALSPAGEIVRGGYYFRLYLPGDGGTGVPELPGGGASDDVDASRAESIWCIYAWPVVVGSTGRRAFFTNQTGQFLFTEVAEYSGAGAPITPGAALAEGGDENSIEGPLAQGLLGRDGNTWRPVGD